jgi:ATP synthase in type III secretion protein N
MPLDLSKLTAAIQEAELVRVEGRIQSVVGLTIHSLLPGVRVGELVEIERRGAEPLRAEVVGFQGERATLFPLGNTAGLSSEDRVYTTGENLKITFSPSLMGRVLDGLGHPMDGGGPIQGTLRKVARDAPDPLSRPRISAPMATGVRAIDGLLTVGFGQRVGLFAGSGVGKSCLLGQIARQAEADVFVICLVGERGKELVEFLEDALGSQGRKRGVVVCATSDSPALLRMKSVYVATAIAEGFRDQGLRVLLLIDNISRFARAAREVALASGETPARRGYPPSVFAALPPLLERYGTALHGSITAFITVLVESDDLDEPVSDEIRGLLDAHVVLSRELANQGSWPAIDVLKSLSRSMSQITSAEHQHAAILARRHLAVYESKRELALLGAYRRGSDPRFDAAADKIDALFTFLRQSNGEKADYEATIESLKRLV